MIIPSFHINFESFKFRLEIDRSKKFPMGSRIYTGHQGMGKTLSMVEYAFRVKRAFPKCKLYSNIILCDIDYIYIKTDKILEEALNFQNGDDGVLILLDEAHLYFGKKNGIPLEVLGAISQQRKDRKRIVFSSQIWEELDISLRKQVKEIVSCKCLFNRLQWNTIKDGYTLQYNKLKSEYEAERIGYDIFKHSNELYNKYDTRQKILRNEEMIQLPVARAPSGLAAAPQQNINNKFWSK